MLSKNLRCLLLAIIVVGLAGCSGGSGIALGTVAGTITKDGQPVSDATITFFPETGRPSSATSDLDGRYSLRFTASENGAIVGKHSVQISYGGPGMPAAPGEPTRGRAKRSLPFEEVTWPEKVTVEKSANTIDFDL
ncbi:MULTISPECIES: carboxypeptidase-like regulatory domain-containing protein [Pirellulaceae]|nr:MULTISPECIES: carboxypeptidase-like regulatory domain-containing protein [Pirellulaceae]